MAFSELAQLIEENSSGVGAFEKAAEQAFNAARQQPDLAAAYFILGAEATDFADSYDRMPITKAISDAAQARFAQHANDLDAASSDPAKLLEVLNRIVGENLG